MIFDSLYGLVRVLVVGSLAYVSLVVILRVSGKRTLAKLNAFDLVVTVSLGSVLASIVLTSEVALAEGVAAIALLCAAQWLVARASVRLRRVRKLVKAEPVLLAWEGEVFGPVLRRERLTEGEVRQAVRAQGRGSLDDIGAVVLETDGTLSVIDRAQLGSAAALVDVEGFVARGQPLRGA